MYIDTVDPSYTNVIKQTEQIVSLQMIVTVTEVCGKGEGKM